MSQANTTQSKKIIFVYNAKAGFMHGFMDLVYKTAKPSTYPCKLCMITFSGATMNKIWKKYITRLGMPSVFMHRDEFANAYPEKTCNFPAVLLQNKGKMTVLLNSQEFNTINDLTQLMHLLTAKLAKSDV